MKGSKGIIARLTGALAAPAGKKPGAAIAASIALAALAALVISRSSFSSDISRLIPSKAEKTSLYIGLMEDFGTMEKLYVVFSSEDINSHLGAVDRIGEELSRLPGLEAVSWKLTDDAKAFTRGTLMNKILLYLSEEEMEVFLSTMEAEGMEAELKKTRRRLALPGAKEATLSDPLNLAGIYLGHMKLGEVSFDMASGYFVTPDGKKLILTANPAGSPRDISYSKRLIGSVREILGANMPAGLRAEVTGAHAIALHEASIMKSEMIRNFSFSLAGVVLIFVLLFRGVGGLLAAVAPVAMSIAFTIALGSLLAGSITEVSGGFSGLLIGLGVDLGAVLYVRYSFHVSRGIAPGQAVSLGISGAGRGVTVGVLTTAATFLPMVLSSFRGVRELGLLTGMGILLTWAMLFFLFPLFSSRRGKPATIRAWPVEATFGLSYRNPRAAVSAVLLVTAALCLFIPRLKVEEDVIKLGTKKNPASETLRGLREAYMDRSNIVLAGKAKDPMEASEKSAEVAVALKQSFSLSDILPPASRQSKNMRALASLDAGEVEDDFRLAAARAGFREGAFDGYIGWLTSAISNRDPVEIGDLAPLGGFVERTLKKEDGGYRFLVTGTLPDADDTSAIDARGVEYTGPPLVRKELLGLLKSDAIKVTLAGLVLVNVLLYLDFRRPSYVLMCQGPVVLSAFWCLGLMGLLGISLNFMNAIVFVMLFGIGTDYSIHLLHRYDEGGDITAMARDTGTAVALAGLTTVVGFGSMAASAYRGLSSLGAATAIGVSACVILTMTLMPVFFRVREAANAGRKIRG